MRVLLVDHDPEGLETIARAIRGVLELDCVTSKGDALLLLRQNTYDVLIACERAVDGSGLDLLGRTTRTAAPLKRIFAAPPERLQLLGPRLAPFKVQRTINYPIDIEELWLAIAQVTGGPDDETDGTIERVVLDERGIPASGTTPRAPIPPRPPAPLGGLRSVPPPSPAAVAAPAAAPAPTPTPAIAVASGGGRTAAARMVQLAPEPPLRAPPPPRAPPAAQQPAPPPQMRTAAPAMQPIPPMPIPPIQGAPAVGTELPGWTAEVPGQDEFAQVAAQARLGVQRNVVDAASGRKRTRLLIAGGIAVVVASALVFLIEKFYDPDAWAREKAIEQEFSRMVEQQKVTDDLTLVEIAIENAITNNELETARTELAKLIEKSPTHARREFLQKSIDRAAELQKFAALDQPVATAAPVSAPPPPVATRPGNVEKSAERAPAKAQERVVARAPERTPPARTTRDTPPSTTASPTRVYGAPVSEPPRRSTIALNSPINSPPTTEPMVREKNFAGRTVEASDSAVGRGTTAVPTSSRSAAVAVQSVAAPAPVPAPSSDVIPAKILKRVTPVVGPDVPPKAKGYVIVEFDISDTGRVSKVSVLESTPRGVFDDSALTAVRKWVYEPRKENGVAVVTSGAKARLVFDPAD